MPPGPRIRQDFGARVFKIARDAQGARLTYLKVTGGTPAGEGLLTNRARMREDAVWEEKADQIRHLLRRQVPHRGGGGGGDRRAP